VRKVLWAVLAAVVILVIDFVPAAVAPRNGPAQAFSSNVTAGDDIKVIVTVAGCTCKPTLTDSIGTRYHLVSSAGSTFTFSGIAQRSKADTLETTFTGITPSSARIDVSETTPTGTSIVQTNSGPLFIFPPATNGLDLHGESSEVELLVATLIALGAMHVTIKVDIPFLRRKLMRFK